MDPVVGDYGLCGWRVASSLPLPDLLPWRGDDRAPDLVVEIGAVPQRPDDPIVDRPVLQVDPGGFCHFDAPGVGAYLIDPDGRRVVIDPLIAETAPGVRMFLFGTVLAILCFRRGLLPLHASCVRIGDGAVAFVGPSGAGKSTLAATFLNRGYPVLADDVVALDVATPGRPLVMPALPRLKLWRDALARLDLSIEGLERARPTLEKYHQPVGAAFHADPLPLRAVVHLDPDSAQDGGVLRRLRGPDAVLRVSRNIYRRGMMVRLGFADRILPASIQVATVADGTFALSHDHAPGGLERSVAAILDQFGG